MSCSQSRTTISGVELSLDADAISPKMLEVLRSGSYEDAEVREIPNIVQSGERIVELGAGIGFLATKAMQTGHVQQYSAYEANPKLIPIIEQTAALNGVSFDIHNAVVDPHVDGRTVPFYLRKDFWASSMSPNPWGYEREIEVPCVSFDAVLDHYRPTMLIVDIEGGEELFFRDLTLTGITKIYVEVHQNIIGRVGMKNVFDFMSSKDFHYDQHHSRGGVILFSHVLR